MKVAICETRLKPRLVEVVSSKGDGTTYTTIPSTLWNDPICDCRGFQFRGTCRHIAELEDDACRWVTEWHQMPNDEKCPNCRAPAILFELSPEFI